MLPCGPCAVGYHFECWRPTEDGSCHCTTEVATSYIDNSTDPPYERKERGGQIKDRQSVGDLESTGRKRAAKLYPIPKENEPGYPMPCEWQGLKFAGGGVLPIIGCIDGRAQHIHHGPDKNTLSNFVGNVHRICTTCHNRFHAINDQYYPKVRPQGDIPYVPIEEYDCKAHNANIMATPEEMALSEVAWTTGKAREFLAGITS